MKKIVCAVVAICMSTSAHAANWWMIVGPTGPLGDRSAFFVDRASVSKVKGFTRAWLSAMKENPAAGSDRSYVQFDCEQRRYMVLQKAKISQNMNYQSNTPPPTWSYVVPDTAMDVISSNVCSGDFYDGMTLKGATLEQFAKTVFAAR